MILKREILAAEARKLIEFHGDDWDSPHAIVTLHPDGEGGLRVGTWVWVADIHGRMWCCQKRRDNGEVRETFHAPGGSRRGHVTDALIKAARATGVAAWGVVPHDGGLN